MQRMGPEHLESYDQIMRFVPDILISEWSQGNLAKSLTIQAGAGHKVCSFYVTAWDVELERILRIGRRRKCSHHEDAEQLLNSSEKISKERALCLKMADTYA